MAKQMIGEMQEGDAVTSYFLVREKIKATTRAGKSYLTVDLMDRSGTIRGMVWDDADRAYDSFTKGEVAAVRGTVESYQGRLQLKVRDIREADERDEKRLDMGDILPRSARDADEMWAELTGFVESIKDQPLRALLEALFGDGETAAAFRRGTAARDMHHNYIGGLLEHTLSVTTVADFLCGHYTFDINRDLVIAGALLHDLGKIREIDSAKEFNYTVEGSLKGHIVIGLEIVRRFADAIEDFPRETLLLLEHLIVSHQGQKEWASPVEPKTPEALVLHLADLTDARMFQMIRAIEKDANRDDPFTQKVYAFGHAVLKVRDADELKGWL
jgi:3'-5' exoribonuclease